MRISVGLRLLLLGLVGHRSNLLHSICTVVQSYQISAADVEAIEVLHCFLGIKYIFVYNKSCSFFIAIFALSDLPDCSEASEHIV